MRFVARSQPPWQVVKLYTRQLRLQMPQAQAAVTVVGATPSMPTRTKIERLLESRK